MANVCKAATRKRRFLQFHETLVAAQHAFKDLDPKDRASYSAHLPILEILLDSLVEGGAMGVLGAEGIPMSARSSGTD